MSTLPDSSARPWTGRLAFYHPTQSGGGAVARLEFHPARPERDGCFFLELARQKTVPTRHETGRQAATFDWENKVTMKWGLSDVGSVLATLQGRLPQAKLFHQTEKANSAFDLTPRDDPERAPYILSVSRQDAADKSLRKVVIPLTHGEAAVLEAALRHAVGPLLGW